MPRKRHHRSSKPLSGAVPLTLFGGDYQEAVTDMITQFQAQLRTATTQEERRELELAIASWSAALSEPPNSKPTRP